MQPITQTYISMVIATWVIVLVQIIWFSFRYNGSEFDIRADRAWGRAADITLGATVLWLTQTLNW